MSNDIEVCDGKLLMVIKRSGRPKGSKTKKAVFTPLDWVEMRNMYVTGHSILEIKSKYHLSSLNNFYRRIEKEGWEKMRLDYFNALTKKELDTVFKSTLADKSDAIKDLRLIRQKAIDAIHEEKVKPFRYGEASQAYMEAIETERKLMIEGLQLSFLHELATILREEIREPLPKAELLLQRIASRCQEMYEKTQKETLREARPYVEINAEPK